MTTKSIRNEFPILIPHPSLSYPMPLPRNTAVGLSMESAPGLTLSITP